MKKAEKYLDIFFYGALILSCFILFTHEDIIFTGNHGMVMLNGNIRDFYSACKEFTGGYDANYMPSTFVLFAIWNLPLRILVGAVETAENVGLVHIYWYKLLPCVFFFMTCFQLRKLVAKLGFSKEKAVFICAVFMTAPLAVYSQFIFCQYDIFTVYFMVRGLQYYFEQKEDKKKHLFFCIFFGIAITFKYHALLFFMVLLFFKEKKLGKILVSLGVAIIPIALETVTYLLLDKEAFTKAVMQFSAFDKISAGTTAAAFTTINPFVVFMCVLLAASFFWEYYSKEEFICNAFFLCSGVCFGAFGLMSWHPQWLLLGCVFWTISTCLNKHCDILLLVDSVGILVYYMFICKLFVDNVDQRLLVNGILHGILKVKDRNQISTMCDIYRSADMEASFLFSILFAIFLVQFIFSHSHFRQKDIFTEIGSKWVLRLRMVVGVFGFMIPALLCLPSMLNRPDVLYEAKETETVDYVLDFENRTIRQTLPLKNCIIEQIQIFTGTFDKEVLHTQLTLDIIDTANNTLVATSSINGDEIRNNEYSKFKFDNSVLGDGTYELQVKSIAYGPDEYTTVYFYLPGEENKNIEMLMIDGDPVVQSSILIRILGTNY